MMSAHAHASSSPASGRIMPAAVKEKPRHCNAGAANRTGCRIKSAQERIDIINLLGGGPVEHDVAHAAVVVENEPVGALVPAENIDRTVIEHVLIGCERAGP